MIEAPLRPVDRTRATRLLLAWLAGDQLLVDNVLEELEPGQDTAGLLFALTSFAAELSVEHAGDQATESLERVLLALAEEPS